jgi:hypothetical protein
MGRHSGLEHVPVLQSHIVQQERNNLMLSRGHLMGEPASGGGAQTSILRWIGKLFAIVFVVYSCLRLLLHSKESTAVLTSQTLQTTAQSKLPLARNEHQFPKLVHQTWKTNDISDLSANLINWRSGCQTLNNEHSFRVHSDSDMMAFVKADYPEYASLFTSLKGVYMADMARVLLLYHYGGTYMDFDFYCVRPIECIASRVRDSLARQFGTNVPRDVLIVSREPLAHALLFRNKSRVVIQDFFLGTPKHPFFKWLLDDRNTKFSNGAQVKGPFSYSVEKEIDEYIKQQRSQSAALYYDSRHSQLSVAVSAPLLPEKSATDGSAFHSVIIELSEDVLHPLVDGTNSKLWTVAPSSPCNILNEFSRLQQRVDFGAELYRQWEQACKRLQNLQYLLPSEHTVGVHMWSHVYLSAPHLRAAVVKPLYAFVEYSLPVTRSCT